jgi:hypothetical protein
MPPPPKAGPELDRRIAKEIFNAKNLDQVPPYSTDDSAAELVIAKLQTPTLRCGLEQFDGRWLCVWWVKFGVKKVEKSERLSMATARTRALAICRSALNLPATHRVSAPEGRQPGSR